MRRFIIGLALTAGCAVANMGAPKPDSGGGGDGGGGDVQADVSVGDSAMNTSSGTFCGQPGRSCSGPSDCCSGECTGKTPQTSYCYDPPVECTANAGTCLIDDDCCSSNCVSGSCAQGCAENGTDCSSSTCCAGSCVDSVCQNGITGCQNVGAKCTIAAQCCTGSCSGGVCAALSCADRGTVCTAPSDCCTGTCSNGACTDAPTCAWAGACTGNFGCCTGTCMPNGQCSPPVGGSACRFLEKQPDDSNFANCYDCMTTSCCDAESSAPIDWQACFQDCMSSFSTWDDYVMCTTKCPPPSAVSTCVTTSCSTECAQ